MNVLKCPKKPEVLYYLFKHKFVLLASIEKLGVITELICSRCVKCVIIRRNLNMLNINDFSVTSVLFTFWNILARLVASLALDCTVLPMLLLLTCLNRFLEQSIRTDSFWVMWILVCIGVASDPQFFLITVNYCSPFTHKKLQYAYALSKGCYRFFLTL